MAETHAGESGSVGEDVCGWDGCGEKGMTGGGRDPEGAVDRTVMDDREVRRRLGAS